MRPGARYRVLLKEKGLHGSVHRVEVVRVHGSACLVRLPALLEDDGCTPSTVLVDAKELMSDSLHDFPGFVQLFHLAVGDMVMRKEYDDAGRYEGMAWVARVTRVTVREVAVVRPRARQGARVAHPSRAQVYPHWRDNELTESKEETFSDVSVFGPSFCIDRDGVEKRKLCFFERYGVSLPPFAFGVPSGEPLARGWGASTEPGVPDKVVYTASCGLRCDSFLAYRACVGGRMDLLSAAAEAAARAPPESAPPAV